MGQMICGGAICRCCFGAAPSSLIILPNARVMSNTPIATIFDNKPLLNIMPFGMCASPANPTVAAATAAALGVLTPMPCIPVTAGPWTPGSPTILIDRQPALNQVSKLMCSWGGVIEIGYPGGCNITIP